MASQCSLPNEVDTVIVGNGPSALILSFILHGNIPHYNTLEPHPDPILQRKILPSPTLLDINVGDLISHFAASRLSYSTQALPINVLLDTLLQPFADTNPGQHESCVEWRRDTSKRVSHVVLGNTSQPGGQWAANPVAGSRDIRALSYAEMLSLPGYSFEQHFKKTCGNKPTDLYRPTRREVAEYLAAYPGVVGIADSIFTNVTVDSVSRTAKGFHIKSHNIDCKHLVLASGVFSNLIPPPPLLKPLSDALPRRPASKLPLVVIGSGFTAADLILSYPPEQKIIHMFKWDMERPSPVQACHPRAYPEYASVYRRMKLAANNILDLQAVRLPLRIKKSNPFSSGRDWDTIYEGLPNTLIKHVELFSDKATITFQRNEGEIFKRDISGLEYVVGRRGSLGYLDGKIQNEILGPNHLSSSEGGGTAEISIHTLRLKVDKSLEIAPQIFAIGSLTGDSLIRFAIGGCIFAASKIIRRAIGGEADREEIITPNSSTVSSPLISPGWKSSEDDNKEYMIANGHEDLGVDGMMLANGEHEDL